MNPTFKTTTYEGVNYKTPVGSHVLTGHAVPSNYSLAVELDDDSAKTLLEYEKTVHYTLGEDAPLKSALSTIEGKTRVYLTMNTTPGHGQLTVFLNEKNKVVTPSDFIGGRVAIQACYRPMRHNEDGSVSFPLKATHVKFKNDNLEIFGMEL